MEQAFYLSSLIFNGVALIVAAFLVTRIIWRIIDRKHRRRDASMYEELMEEIRRIDRWIEREKKFTRRSLWRLRVKIHGLRESPIEEEVEHTQETKPVDDTTVTRLAKLGVRLMDIPEGHLQTICYKLANNRIYEYKHKSELVIMILRYLEASLETLIGKTLPADMGFIDTINIQVGNTIPYSEVLEEMKRIASLQKPK